MKAIVVGIMLAALVASAQTGEAARQLKAARNAELVDGDLHAAIKQYAAIVSRYVKTDRAVTAMAMVHMAECYQKMGNAESRKLYEQVLRDFGDLKEPAALARSRLSVASPNVQAKSDRAVWTGSLVDMFGRVSPDGRFITFIDWNNGRLMVHDVTANVDRELTPAARGFSQSAGYSAFSRDGKQLVYVWSDDQNRQSLRIAAFQGTAILNPRQFFTANDDVRFIDAFDLSPDGKWIAAAIRRTDGTGQVALIALADGSFRVLKSMDWNVPARIFFSLDSKYIAYDHSTTDTSQERDVYVLAIDGSRETPAVVHPAREGVLGWSPDGRHLLFSSDRTGSVGLWALPFADGKPQGAPELLKSDIGDSMSLGVTASGSAYLYKGISSRDVSIARVDWNAGKLLEPPSSFGQGFLPGTKNPSWSPDGKYLAYASCGGDCLAVRSVDTGQVRKLTRTRLYARNPQWSPDGRSLLVTGRDHKGRDGVFQVDAQSGNSSSVVSTTRLGFSPQWSPDGRKIYYINGAGPAIVERDLTSGAEREVTRHPRLWREVHLSPDGRYLAVQTGVDPSTKTSVLLLVPVAGGQSRELVRLTQPEQWGPVGTTSWTPDNKAVLKLKRNGSGTELLLVPITGEPPRKLDIDSDRWMQGSTGGLDQGFSLSPDGDKIAFLMGKSASEVWAIENFLPNLRTSK